MISYPYPSVRHLAERVDAAPRGVYPRRWVLRDDNGQHYHGVLELSPDPVFLQLWWKPDARGREQLVGLYRLNLQGLLEEGFVRAEGDESPPARIRLRFVRGDRSVVSIQSRGDAPALAVGVVDMAG